MLAQVWETGRPVVPNIASISVRYSSLPWVCLTRIECWPCLRPQISSASRTDTKVDEETADDHIGLASTKTTDYINEENNQFDVDGEEFMNQVGNNKASENTSDVNKNS